VPTSATLVAGFCVAHLGLDQCPRTASSTRTSNYAGMREALAHQPAHQVSRIARPHPLYGVASILRTAKGGVYPIAKPTEEDVPLGIRVELLGGVWRQKVDAHARQLLLCLGRVVVAVPYDQPGGALGEFQILPIVDTEGVFELVRSDGLHATSTVGKDLYDVGEIILALGGVAGQTRQVPPLRLGVEAVYAHGELLYLELLEGTILDLYHLPHVAVLVPDDAAIVGRIFQYHRHDGSGGIRPRSGIDERADTRRAEKRHVAVADEDRAGDSSRRGSACRTA
jgi:hypothetical protein